MPAQSLHFTTSHHQRLHAPRPRTGSEAAAAQTSKKMRVGEIFDRLENTTDMIDDLLIIASQRDSRFVSLSDLLYFNTAPLMSNVIQ